MDKVVEIRSEIVLAGHAYWLAKKGDRAMPRRADLDPPLDLPRLAPNIIVFDALHAPLDFRYRLIGSLVRRHLTQDLVGKKMSEIDFQREPSVLWSHHAWVIEHRTPRFMRPPYVGPHREFLFLEAVILPLAAADSAADGTSAPIDKLMVFVDFTRR
jgi:hypothetical protein